MSLPCAEFFRLRFSNFALLLAETLFADGNCRANAGQYRGSQHELQSGCGLFTDPSGH